MSYKLTRENEPFLLRHVEDVTRTAGWKADAVAYGAIQKTAPGFGAPLVAAGVYENFAGREADFSFAMFPGYQINRGIIEAFKALSFHPMGLNLDRLWMMASDENTLSQRLILHIGARFQFRKRAGASDGSDAIVFLLERKPLHTPAAKASTDQQDED